MCIGPGGLLYTGELGKEVVGMPKKNRADAPEGVSEHTPAEEENKPEETQQDKPAEGTVKDGIPTGGEGSADVDVSEGSEDKERIELLRAIKKNTSRTFMMQCVSSCCMVGILIALLFTVFSLLPMVMETLRTVTDTVTTVNDLALEADGAIKEINTMSRSITATSERVSGVIEDNAETLTDAVTQINNIDFEGLNKAIKDLEDAVGPFATAANSLKGFSLFGR